MEEGTSGCLSYTALMIGAIRGSPVCLPGLSGLVLLLSQELQALWENPFCTVKEALNIETREKTLNVEGVWGRSLQSAALRRRRQTQKVTA